MTSIREKDYAHANERGNGPKNRMEGGDQTDDISINDPDTRVKEMRQIKIDQSDEDESAAMEFQKAAQQ